MNKKAIVQLHPMGCGLACVAFATNKTYQEIFKKCNTKEYAWTRGFYCSEIVKLLKIFNITYNWRKNKINKSGHKFKPLTIVFCKPTKKYPAGHFLIRDHFGYWMNPWINHPIMVPAKAGFQKKLPSKITYLIEPKE